MLDPNLHPINVLPLLLDGVLGGFDWNFDLVFVSFDRGVVVAGKRTSRGLMMIPVIGYPSPIGPFLCHCLSLKRIELGSLVLRMGGKHIDVVVFGFPVQLLKTQGYIQV